MPSDSIPLLILALIIACVVIVYSLVAIGRTAYQLSPHLASSTKLKYSGVIVGNILGAILLAFRIYHVTHIHASKVDIAESYVRGVVMLLISIFQLELIKVFKVLGNRQWSDFAITGIEVLMVLFHLGLYGARYIIGFLKVDDSAFNQISLWAHWGTLAIAVIQISLDAIINFQIMKRLKTYTTNKRLTPAKEIPILQRWRVMKRLMFVSSIFDLTALTLYIIYICVPLTSEYVRIYLLSILDSFIALHWANLAVIFLLIMSVALPNGTKKPERVPVRPVDLDVTKRIEEGPAMSVVSQYMDTLFIQE